MAIDLPGLRPAVLPEADVAALDEYLRFRHLFRNAYGFELDWTRIRPLLQRLGPLHAAVTTALQRFCDALETLGG